MCCGVNGKGKRRTIRGRLTVVKNADLGFKCYLCLLLFVCQWASYLASLCLNFIIRKMRVMVVSTLIGLL